MAGSQGTDASLLSMEQLMEGARIAEQSTYPDRQWESWMRAHSDAKWAYDEAKSKGRSQKFLAKLHEKIVVTAEEEEKARVKKREADQVWVAFQEKTGGVNPIDAWELYHGRRWPYYRM